MCFQLRHFVIAGSLYIVLSLLLAPRYFIPAESNDTSTYTDVSQSLLHGESPRLYHRTLGYPAFLLASQYFESKPLVWGMQLAVGLLAFLCYNSLLAKYVFQNPTAVIISAFLTWGLFHIMGWQGMMLPEFLEISVLMIWLWFDLRQRTSPEMLSWFFLLACWMDITLMVIKPVFFAWPVLLQTTRVIMGLVRARRIKKEVLRLLVILSFGIGWCGFIYHETGHFEVSDVGRVNRLLMINNFGQLSAGFCRVHPCAPLTRETIHLMVTHQEHLLNKIQQLHPELTRNKIIDTLSDDLYGPTRRALARHAVLQFFYNFGDDQSRAQYTPLFPKFLNLWFFLSKIWKTCLEIGLVLFFLNMFMRFPRSPFIFICLGLVFYNSLIAALWGSQAYSRIMAPTEAMAGFLGLYGFIGVIRSLRSLVRS